MTLTNADEVLRIEWLKDYRTNAVSGVGVIYGGMRSCLLLCCYIERNGEIENRKAASIVIAALILEKALLFVNYIQNIGCCQLLLK